MAKMIQRTTAFERFTHLLMALSGLALLLTGFGFSYPTQLGWINSIFGGVQVASGIHRWGGIVFIISLVFSLITWLPECFKWSSDDSKWISMLGGYLSKDSAPPPQGKINAGQKIVGILIFVFGAVFAVSGLLLWTNSGVKSAMMIWHLLHNVAFLIYAVFIPLHIYMATAANPGTFRIMTRGDVPLYWAKKKHAKWVKEIGAE